MGANLSWQEQIVNQVGPLIWHPSIAGSGRCYNTWECQTHEDNHMVIHEREGLWAVMAVKHGEVMEHGNCDSDHMVPTLLLSLVEKYKLRAP